MALCHYRKVILNRNATCWTTVFFYCCFWWAICPISTDTVRMNSIISWSFSELQICMSVKSQLWARGWICSSSPTYSREWHASAVRETQHHNESWCSTGQRASQCSSFRFPPTAAERCPLWSSVIACYLQPCFQMHFCPLPTSFWTTLFRLIFSI